MTDGNLFSAPWPEDALFISPDGAAEVRYTNINGTDAIAVQFHDSLAGNCVVLLNVLGAALITEDVRQMLQPEILKALRDDWHRRTNE